MTSTFAKIVKSQRLDGQRQDERAFDARNILTLADRVRRGQIKQSRLKILLQRLIRIWRKLLRTIFR